MDEMEKINSVCLRGVLSGRPELSHESRGQRFYVFPLEVERLSGARDTLRVLARASLLEALELAEGHKLYVSGELRSFNNKSGVGSRLVISVFARELRLEDGEDMNLVQLRGVLCKAPKLRVTPMGREICDLMLAVNRPYGRSDYLPCIAWGAQARQCALWPVGSPLGLAGRIQSRRYIKLAEGQQTERTAYEVSVTEARLLPTAP